MLSLRTYFACCESDRRCNAKDSGRVCESNRLGTRSFLKHVTRWSIWIFAFIIALSHLGIAQAFMQVLFTGVVAMLALAGGLAFGLGGRDASNRIY